MKKGISSNILKIIAIIAMIIDHIAMYLHSEFYLETYVLFRNIGRIAMPIFAYLIVQGFFYTKDLPKYILRLFIVAIITQISLTWLEDINQIYFPNYNLRGTEQLNILFSYTFSLVLLTIIDRNKIIEKFDEKKNIFIKINIFIILLFIYLNFKMDYQLIVPFIMLELYGIEKLFQNEDKMLLKAQEKIEMKQELKYLGLILISFILVVYFMEDTIVNKWALLYSIIPIALYNGQKGRKSKLIQYSFYAFFPIHHTLLYLLGMMN